MTFKKTDKGSHKITAESPDADIFAEEELDKILNSVKLRELTERLAQRRNTSTGEALKIVLRKLGVRASELANGNK